MLQGYRFLGFTQSWWIGLFIATLKMLSDLCVEQIISSEHLELQKFCLVLFTWWTFTDIAELWKYSGQVRQPFGDREGTEK